MKKKIAIILGTRPEIIKLSPIIRECQKRHLDFFILHTNQHYSKNLDDIFFKNLKLPKPKYNLKVGSGTHAEITAKMLVGIERILKKEAPMVVLIQGDTNTVLAGALAAVKLNIKIGHIEAGLRSYFKLMPEETNRIVTDHCSDFLFTPTKLSKDILLKEGINNKDIFVVGNTIVDALFQNLKLSKNSTILNILNIKPKSYFLATIHRQENVDDKKRLQAIIKGLETISIKFNKDVILPIHPRTKNDISKFKIKIPKGIKIIEPIGYLDFINLEFHASLIFTDSGGIQEEACILKIPCVTLRDNTERPETVMVGANILAGVSLQRIIIGTQKMLKKRNNWHNPFGNGSTSKKILDIIFKNIKDKK